MNASSLWLDQPPFCEIPAENKWALIRQHRKVLLFDCDWTQLPDAPLTLEEKQAWASYRQSLRDIPQDYPIADDVVFPEIP